MCQNRSCVLSECLDTAKATRVANTHGGAQSRRVTVRLYFSVAASVGKNALNERKMTMDVSARASHHTLQSEIAANKLCSWPLLSVSPSSPTPTSSCIRRSESITSSGESHRPEVEGKSGRMNTAQIAAKIVRAPSIKKSHLSLQECHEYLLRHELEPVKTHLQAACPSLPSIPSRMPEARRAPKALLIRLPQERSAVRSPSSLRVYHFDKRKRAPGKNAASIKPRKKRVRSAPTKLVATPVRQDIIPHIIMQIGRYNEGRPM